MARIRSIKPEFNVYCIAESGDEISGPCKVGIAKDVERRRSALQCGNPRRLVVVWSIGANSVLEAKEAEQFALRILRPSMFSANKEDRLESEWLSHPPKAVKARVSRMLSCFDEAA